MTIYKDTTIERNINGYYKASVLIGGTYNGYYVPLQADTLTGIKQLITDTIKRKRIKQ